MDYKNFIFSPKKIRDTKFILYHYNDDDIRIVKLNSCRKKGFEEIGAQQNLTEKTEKKEIDRISISRTRRNIREIALCNDFEYFATFTINEKKCNRFSLQECQDLLRNRLKALKRKNKQFAYIFITEKHKNGAYHFHGLIKGIDNFYINNNGYYSHEIFDALGFNSFSKIKDYNKCCNYITKYITKDCVKNDARHGIYK